MGRVDDDPLTLALSPPPNETPGEREKRLVEEARARDISEAIDEEIKVQRNALKKKPNVKVLLLGQSESGKHHLLSYSSATFLLVYQCSVERSIINVLFPCLCQANRPP